MEKIITGNTVISESIAVSFLTIEEGAVLTAPENKYLTLTVDGETRTIAPGTYTGDVRITVCDNFTRTSLRFGQPTVSNYHAAVIVDNGKLVENSSVAAAVRQGTVTDKKADGVKIDSREWDFNGFYLTGDTEYEINDSEITMVGDGTDDFVGMGASIACSGTTKLTVNNTKISNKGIGRGTLFCGGESVVTLNNCEFEAFAAEPTPEEMAAGKEAERMMEPPWAIGLKGNVRTLNLAEKSTLTLNDCKMTCNRWGVLSIDGACLNRMYINNSEINITGDNGYGFFCIADDIMFDYSAIDEPGCLNVASNSTFNVAYTAALMSLGNGCTEFKDGTVVNSRRFGVCCHRHDGGSLKVNSGSTFNTAKSSFVVKGSTLHIVLDNCTLNPGNGTILQLMDNDDVGMCDDPFLVPVGEVDVRDDRDLTTAIEGEDIFVTVTNMTANGSFFNSTTDMRCCNRRLPPPADCPPPPPPPEDFMAAAAKLRGFMGPVLMGAKNLDIQIENATVNGCISAATAAYGEGITQIDHDHCDELSNITQTPAPAINNGVIVTVKNGGVWNVPGACYLTKLVIEEGGIVNGTMTVDGAAVEVKPGTYTGAIVLNAR